eukprot:TRINITY_DN32502_c0_g1_i1.p1 TRINITY_DN32502_c0_g1~~TRINITY_DN32502_c0_g1_i1.p1  ORF type:complete len:1416 (-),score=283.97 TRINITY_DN32502_c0_g1_i1:229-4476(-)
MDSFASSSPVLSSITGRLVDENCYGCSQLSSLSVSSNCTFAASRSRLQSNQWKTGTPLRSSRMYVRKNEYRGHQFGHTTVFRAQSLHRAGDVANFLSNRMAMRHRSNNSFMCLPEGVDRGDALFRSETHGRELALLISPTNWHPRPGQRWSTSKSLRLRHSQATRSANSKEGLMLTAEERQELEFGKLIGEDMLPIILAKRADPSMTHLKARKLMAGKKSGSLASALAPKIVQEYTRTADGIEERVPSSTSKAEPQRSNTKRKPDAPKLVRPPRPPGMEEPPRALAGVSTDFSTGRTAGRLLEKESKVVRQDATEAELRRILPTRRPGLMGSDEPDGMPPADLGDYDYDEGDYDDVEDLDLAALEEEYWKANRGTRKVAVVAAAEKQKGGEKGVLRRPGSGGVKATQGGAAKRGTPASAAASDSKEAVAVRKPSLYGAMSPGGLPPSDREDGDEDIEDYRPPQRRVKKTEVAMSDAKEIDEKRVLRRPPTRGALLDSSPAQQGPSEDREFQMSASQEGKSILSAGETVTKADANVNALEADSSDGRTVQTASLPPLSSKPAPLSRADTSANELKAVDATDPIKSPPPLPPLFPSASRPAIGRALPEARKSSVPTPPLTSALPPLVPEPAAAAPTGGAERTDKVLARQGWSERVQEAVRRVEAIEERQQLAGDAADGSSSNAGRLISRPLPAAAAAKLSLRESRKADLPPAPLPPLRRAVSRPPLRPLTAPAPSAPPPSNSQSTSSPAPFPSPTPPPSFTPLSPLAQQPSKAGIDAPPGNGPVEAMGFEEPSLSSKSKALVQPEPRAAVTKLPLARAPTPRPAPSSLSPLPAASAAPSLPAVSSPPAKVTPEASESQLATSAESSSDSQVVSDTGADKTFLTAAPPVPIRAPALSKSDDSGVAEGKAESRVLKLPRPLPPAVAPSARLQQPPKPQAPPALSGLATAASSGSGWTKGGQGPPTTVEVPLAAEAIDSAASWARAEACKLSGEIVEVQVVGCNNGGLLVKFESLAGFIPLSSLHPSRCPPDFPTWAAAQGIDISSWDKPQSRSLTSTSPSPPLSSPLSPTSPSASSNTATENGTLSSSKSLQESSPPSENPNSNAAALEDKALEGARVLLRSNGENAERGFEKAGAGGLEKGVERIEEERTRLLLRYKRDRLQMLARNVGNKLMVLVLEVNEGRRQLVMGEAEIDQRRVMNSLQVGDVVTCTVKKLTTFGAFVEVKEKDGEGVTNALIHASEIMYGRPYGQALATLTVGQVVKARVQTLDKEMKRIGLSIKRMKADPLESPMDSLAEAGVATEDMLAGPSPSESLTPGDSSAGVGGMEELAGGMERLRAVDGVEAVTLGRRLRGQALAPAFQVYLASQQDGPEYRLLARAGAEIQEVLVTTTNDFDRERFKEAVRVSFEVWEEPKAAQV